MLIKCYYKLKKINYLIIFLRFNYKVFIGSELILFIS